MKIASIVTAAVMSLAATVPLASSAFAGPTEGPATKDPVSAQKPAAKEHAKEHRSNAASAPATPKKSKPSPSATHGKPASKPVQCKAGSKDPACQTKTPVAAPPPKAHPTK